MKITFGVTMGISEDEIAKNAKDCDMDIEVYKKGLIEDKLDLLKSLTESEHVGFEVSTVGAE
jgi:hypothetical protein